MRDSVVHKKMSVPGTNNGRARAGQAGIAKADCDSDGVAARSIDGRPHMGWDPPVILHLPVGRDRLSEFAENLGRDPSPVFGMAIGKLAQEDPTLRVSVDHETGQTILAGMGELHLEIIVDRMKREFGVEANVGKPQVAYRETITQAAAGKEVFKKQTGGRGQYAHVEIEVEPAPGEGFVFENEITGGAIPREFIKPTEAGIQDAMERGRRSAAISRHELPPLRSASPERRQARSAEHPLLSGCRRC